MISSAVEFGNLLKQVRKQSKLTQAQLAAACNTGERFIRELERGKSSCQLGKALHVAKMLGIHFITKTPFEQKE